jgi:hypothetical protein
MRFGKPSFHPSFAKAIEDRAAEHKNEQRDAEDERTEANTRVSRQPPQ